MRVCKREVERGDNKKIGKKIPVINLSVSECYQASGGMPAFKE